MTVTSSIHGIFTILVYNILGIKIYETHQEVLNGISEYQIDLSPISSGVYTAELRNNQTEIVKKFVIGK